MRNPDVSQDEMMIGRLDDAGLDDLIEGRDGDGPASLRELFDAIRIEAEATPPCVPSAALERYVRPPSAAPRVRRRSRRSRAAVGAAAFAGTLAGKLVLGATVAAASVGVAHFAHVIDVPGLPARPLLIVSDEGVSEGDTADDAKLPSDLIEGEGTTSGTSDTPVNGPDPASGVDTADNDESPLEDLRDLQGCEAGQDNSNRPENLGVADQAADPCDRPEAGGGGKPDGAVEGNDSGVNGDGELPPAGKKPEEQGSNGSNGQGTGGAKTSGPAAPANEGESGSNDGKGNANSEGKKPKS